MSGRKKSMTVWNMKPTSAPKYMDEYVSGQGLSSEIDANRDAIPTTSKLAAGENMNVYDKIVEAEGTITGSIQTACVGIQAYLRQGIGIDENMYPIELYVKDQCILFLWSILADVKIRTFSCGQLREGIENLYNMTFYLNTIESSAATLAAKEVCTIISILENSLNLAEMFSGATQTNCKRVTDFIKSTYPEGQVDMQMYHGRAEYFKLEKLLGAGGFGAVYRASINGVECAVKFVPLKLLPDPENATVDKKVASLINHSCLVNYFACFCTVESYVTVMEYIRGVDVIKLLKTSGKLPNELVKLVIGQLGLALQHMHYKGFIHRDVKPSNVMISRGCRVKLFDFDTAKVCYSKFHKKYMYHFSKKTVEEFKDSEIAGTMGYMAPEVFRKEGYGRAVDWYSLGVTAFELSTARLPFRVDNKTFEAQKAIISRGRFAWPKDHDDYVLQVFVDYCLRAKKHRICTKRYLEFLFHPYFEGVSWETIETGEILLEYEPLNQLIGLSTPEEFAYNSTPNESQESLTRIERAVTGLFGLPYPQFQDLPKQKPMFVFSSNEFRNLVQVIKKEQFKAIETLYRPHENVYMTEDRENFIFEGM